MATRCWSALLAFVVLALAPTGPLLSAEPPIGIYTAIYGDVRVVHASAAETQVVRLQDQVHFMDTIRTGTDSRMRALLDDDTLLTLGEDSQLEITEHIYDPQAHRRSAVLRLVKGTVRALVAKVLGQGSRFEIHTDSAIAAARGTYFVVWTEPEGGTGLANIGDEGDVELRAAGESVVVGPGYYAVTHRGQAPSAPILIPWDGAPAAAVARTQVRDNVVNHRPKQTVRSAGGILEKELPTPDLSLRQVPGGPERGPKSENGRKLGLKDREIGETRGEPADVGGPPLGRPASPPAAPGFRGASPSLPAAATGIGAGIGVGLGREIGGERGGNATPNPPGHAKGLNK